MLMDFHEWGKPWTYISAVLAQQGFGRPEIELINELWAEVTNAKHWVEPSFRTSDELIREKLETAYAWLSKAAVDSLIRGASYVWK